LFSLTIWKSITVLKSPPITKGLSECVFINCSMLSGKTLS